MSASRRTPSPRATRRARREAQSKALKKAATQPARGGLPLGWLTVGAVAVAAVIIVAVVFLNSSPAPLKSPTAVSPTGITDGQSLGSKTAPVKLDLWADFQCPGCRNFTLNIEPLLVSAYIQTGKAQLTFHDFAFLGNESVQAAEAASCAGQQGKFWPYHDYLYANQGAENSGAFERSRLVAIAAAVGLDQAKFTSCLDGGSMAQAVSASYTAGTQLGVTQTPTLFVNGVMSQNTLDYQTISSEIDQALAAASASPGASATPAASASSSP